MKPLIRSMGLAPAIWQVPLVVGRSHRSSQPVDRKQQLVVGAPIDVVDWDAAIARIQGWADARESRMVSMCKVHTVVTARRDARLGTALRHSDLNAAAG